MRYLISGIYGQRNVGDEAVLAGIIQEIRRRDTDARFTVLSFDPEDTRRRHGVEALSTTLRDPGALASAMRAADLLISGGGSILHEADFEQFGRSFFFYGGKLRPVPYFLSIVLMARALRLPVMWYAQGLGPLNTRAARRLVGLAGSASQVVTWRDADSARLAAEVGVRPPVQLIVPDPAYALEPASPEVTAAALRAAGLPPGLPYIAVCPRPWLDRTGFLQSLVTAVACVAAERDLAVLLVPFHGYLDASLCADLAASSGLSGRAFVIHGTDPGETADPGGIAGPASAANAALAPGAPEMPDPALVAGLLRDAECAVTMRLHSGILAALAGTPAVSIDYDPKVASFADQTGQAHWAVSVDELESPAGAAALEVALRATLDDLPGRRAALRRRVASLRTEAGRTAALAVQLAAGSSGS